MIDRVVLAVALALCVQDKPAPQEAVGAQEGPNAEVEALVQRVKAQLSAVDQALQAAADADKAAPDLATAREAHLSVIRDIEELIKQIKYTESQSPSRSRSSDSQQRSEGGADETPQPQPAPRQSDGEQRSERRPDGQPPQAEPQDGQPAGGQPGEQPPGQRPGDRPPPPPETGRFEREDTDARWGLLPPKIQERLMNLHVDDMPERYRSWLDAYIRQLNRLEQGDGTR